MVNFVEFQYRKGKSTKEIMDEIRAAVQGYPGVTITVDKDAAGPPVGKAISIEITGEDYPTLIEITENLKNFHYRIWDRGYREVANRFGNWQT